MDGSAWIDPVKKRSAQRSAYYHRRKVEDPEGHRAYLDSRNAKAKEDRDWLKANFPEVWREKRAKLTADARARNAANPKRRARGKKTPEQRAAAWAKLKADPERHAIYLEKRREYWRTLGRLLPKGEFRNQERYQTIKALHEKGWSYRAIGNELGISRTTVLRYLSPKYREKAQAYKDKWEKETRADPVCGPVFREQRNSYRRTRREAGLPWWQS